MGFYLRRSFRAGPIRFNLSKSGIGASAGVTGACLGVSSAVALIHQGVTSLPIGRILDVEVDHDRRLLVLTRDGVATPTDLTTPDALRAGAIVAALTESR